MPPTRLCTAISQVAAARVQWDGRQRSMLKVLVVTYSVMCGLVVMPSRAFLLMCCMPLSTYAGCSSREAHHSAVSTMACYITCAAFGLARCGQGVTIIVIARLSAALCIACRVYEML